jgi:hypothetical protein
MEYTVSMLDQAVIVSLVLVGCPVRISAGTQAILRFFFLFCEFSQSTTASLQILKNSLLLRPPPPFEATGVQPQILTTSLNKPQVHTTYCCYFCYSHSVPSSYYPFVLLFFFFINTARATVPSGSERRTKSHGYSPTVNVFNLAALNTMRSGVH